MSEAEIARAVLLAAEDMKMIVEPGGAVGLAVTLRAMEARDGRHVAVLGGGNMPVSRLDEMRALLR